MGKIALLIKNKQVGLLIVLMVLILFPSSGLLAMEEESPLFKAMSKPVELFEQLLRAGADPNVRKFNGPLTGISCLHALLCWTDVPDREKKIQLLLTHKADPNIQAFYKDTPLMYAVADFPSAIPLLLQAGADINQPNENGFTALSRAVNKRSKIAVRLLLTNKIQAPHFHYGQLVAAVNQYRHVFYLARSEEQTFSGVHPIIAADFRAIGRALKQFEGLYTYRGRIAKKGLAQILPEDIVKIIAMHCEYPSLQANNINKP